MTAPGKSKVSSTPPDDAYKPAPPADAYKPTESGPACDAELEILIRARYPLLMVISFEEERVMKALDGIAVKSSKQLYHWSINSGLIKYRRNVKGAVEGKKGTKDPIIALREIELGKDDPTIFVLKDFSRFMDEAPVVRGLRDLAATLRETYSTVVILTPVMKVPPELEKELTIVDYPLPDREALGQLFDRMVEETKDNPDIEIDTSDEAKLQLLDAAIGLTLNETESVFAKTLLRKGRLTEAEAPAVYEEKRQIVRKSGLLEYIDTTESIDGIGGLANLKDWLRKRRRAFHPAARKFGLPVPKGVLILGVQGCGKSLSAKAVARYWRMPLLRLDMGRLFGSLVGASEQNVRKAIMLAESLSPAILWIDEIDKGFAGMSSSGSTDSGTTSRVFATLITWLQEKTAPVFVIATANNIEHLPPELLRQGRFDEIFFVDLPNAEERAAIFRIHLIKRRRNPERFDLDALTAATGGYSGAEIEQSIISALYDAFDESRDIDQQLLIEAIAKTSPLSKIMAKEINQRREWARARARPAS